MRHFNYAKEFVSSGRYYRQPGRFLHFKGMSQVFLHYAEVHLERKILLF